ncbi:hypothetical protein [Streptodolium elevatio]|uniref:DUF8175 domain-containing protein n=1 Tax=Streptodolium elevatio TaxID=3157996 RepID=A0ABV3DLQ0_9ACTN
MSDELPRTRTLLPPRPDAVGVPARRRNPVLSGIGVVVVIMVVVLTLAYASRRGGGDTPSGTENAGSSQSATTTGAPPSGALSGVPVGYAHTREGAQSAAANYSTAYGSSAMFKPASRRAVISALAAPTAKDGLLTRADGAFAAQNTLFGLDAEGNAPKGLTFVCRALPVGTKVAAYTPDSATVEVWGAGLIGLAGAGSTKPVTEAWTTTTMRLSWADGDWKLVDFSQKEGPTPVSGLQGASGAEEIAQAVRDFEELRYAR